MGDNGLLVQYFNANTPADQTLWTQAVKDAPVLKKMGATAVWFPPAKAELARHGISCEGKRARQVTRADYAEYDYLIGMDGANIRNMLRIFGGDPHKKVAKLLSYAGWERDISDPWYTGDFGTTYDDVLEGCAAFLEYLQQNIKIDT